MLILVENDYPINAVFTADTGMEFPEMYEHLARLDKYLYENRGIHITVLRHPKGFEYLMFEVPQQKKQAIERWVTLNQSLTGYGWLGVFVRWCTGQLKTHLINKEVNRLKQNKNAIQCIGIAADEGKRCKDDSKIRYPLVELGVTEKLALQICYEHGFDFGGLYEIYNRASCWCCPLQRIDELHKLRRHHPELWAHLLEMDRRALAQFGDTPLGWFKKGWTVQKLDERFAKEDLNEKEKVA